MTATHMRTCITPVGWLVLAEAGLLLSSRWWPARAIPEPTTMALGFGLGAVVLVAWWLAPRQTLAAEAEWLVAACVPVGEEVTVGATLTVHGNLPPCTIEAMNPAHRRRREVVRLRALSPGRVRPTWTVRFPKRGVVQLPPLRLCCSQPFGVISVERTVGLGREVVVLPAMGQIVLDTSGRAPEGVLEGRRFEKLVAATATLADACVRRGWQVTVHGGFAPGGISGDTGRLLEGLAMASCDGANLADVIPLQPAVVVLTARPGDVPLLRHRPLILGLSELDDLFRLPARLR